MVFVPLLRPAMRRERVMALAGLALVAAPALVTRPCPAQQSTAPRERERDREVPSARAPRPAGVTWTYSSAIDEDKRAVLGVALGASGRRDTLGVLIEEVTPDGPAAKAGLAEGARVQAINGVNLRVAAADVDDPDLRGIGERRLRRELGKLTPGDEVELRVAMDGAVKTVRVKTVAASALAAPLVRSVRETRDDRAYLGLAIGTTGTARDTLGLFISSVTTGGPAEQAGIIEGERIQSVNGVDLRVPREDAGDWQLSTARANRFTRVLREAKAGDVLTLEVQSGGRTRSVKVTAGKTGDFSGRRGSWQMRIGDDAMFFERPEPPARPPFDVRLQRLGDDLEWQLDGLRVDGARLGRTVTGEVRRALEEVREALPRIEVERRPQGVTILSGPRLRRITL